MNVEDRVRTGLRTIDLPPPRLGAGAAYERFRVRRRRRTRAVTAVTGIAFVVMLGATATIPRLVADRQGALGTAGDGVVSKARHGFEFAPPRGWEVTEDTIDERGFGGSLTLRPVDAQPPQKGQPATAQTPSIELRMELYDPGSYPGRPAADPRAIPAELGMTSILSDDRTAPEPGRRADGRAYLLLEETAGGTGGGGGSLRAVIAWPYHCATGSTCSAAGDYRVLAVSAFAPSSQAMATVRPVTEALIEAIRPIGNALPGGAEADEEPALPFSAPVRVGTTATGERTWTVSAQWHDWPQADPRLRDSTRPTRTVLATFQLDGDRYYATVDTGGNGIVDPGQTLWAEGQCLGPDADPRGWVPTLVGITDARAVTVRLERTGGQPVDVPVFGKDQGFDVGFFVGPALPRETQVPKLQALDADGRVIGELTRYDGFDRLCTGRRVVR